MTNRFKENFYVNFQTVPFPVATNDTAELIRYAGKGLEAIYRKGYLYKKAGVMFNDLVSENCIQQGLFDTRERGRHDRLMETVDRVNAKMGSGALKHAALGFGNNPDWKTMFNRRSPSYTTNWDQLPEVS